MPGDTGIHCNQEQMVNGQCSMDIYQTMGLRDQGGGTDNADDFIKEVFSGATMFITTIVVVAFIVSGLMFIFGGANESMASKGKDGLKYSIIGFLLVVLSYVIVKGVQFLATGK